MLPLLPIYREINHRIHSEMRLILITSIVLPLPGGPNNKIPRTGARKPVNTFYKKNK